MLFSTMGVRDNYFLSFLFGMTAATILEYVSGVAMLTIFKVRYWDYRYKKINFQGHICLTSSLAWGVFTILLTKWIHKPVEKLCFRIPKTYLNIFSGVFFALFLVDLGVSVSAGITYRRFIKNMNDRIINTRENLIKQMRYVLGAGTTSTLIGIGKQAKSFTDKASDRVEELEVKAEVITGAYALYVYRYIKKIWSVWKQTVIDKTEEIIAFVEAIPGEVEAMPEKIRKEYDSFKAKYYGEKEKILNFSRKSMKTLAYFVSNYPEIQTKAYSVTKDYLKKKTKEFKQDLIGKGVGDIIRDEEAFQELLRTNPDGNDSEELFGDSEAEMALEQEAIPEEFRKHEGI